MDDKRENLGMDRGLSMVRKESTIYAHSVNQVPRLVDNAISEGARKLTAYELAELRRDMAESSAKMRTELARRRNDCPTKQDW